MLLEGTTKCEHCKKDFDWYNILAEPSNGSSLYQVHTSPENKEPIRNVLEWDKNKIPSKVTAYCPHCDKLNTFNV